MKLMQPIITSEIPTGEEWAYEVKYDGFRCTLHIEKNKIRLISRNEVDLTDKFPEIIEFCSALKKKITKLLPLKLDGELTIVNNRYQSNFMAIQKRGRLNKKETIGEASLTRPASFLAFDILIQKGAVLKGKPYTERKEMLHAFFIAAGIEPQISRLHRISFIPFLNNAEIAWNNVFHYKGEGLIAKRKTSKYSAGKQHNNDWKKIKNWLHLDGILTYFDNENDYYTVNVYDETKKLIEIGKCKHGVDETELKTLKQLFVTSGNKCQGGYKLPPAICVEINTLALIKGEVREPSIKRILLNHAPEACTTAKMNLDLAMIPEVVEPTNTSKLFWPDKGVTKGDLLIYLREIYPYMIPFLREKLLTLIRCPDGVKKEFFYQKHLPAYAPSFIKSYPVNDEKLFICNQLESLMWFGNHGAIEYHTPFQTIDGPNPVEIVFDLDPPDRSRFDLAVHAATVLKQLLDDLTLTSFVKTSGNKGIQVHIPIPKNSLTYKETGIFTEAIAVTIEHAHPTLFTTERLKKNRKGRLYIDYVQHAKDKTIITAYSPRKTNEATVAAPLFWEEVDKGLKPEMFTIQNVVQRINSLGCPFTGYYEIGQNQTMEKVFHLLGKNK